MESGVGVGGNGGRVLLWVGEPPRADAETLLRECGWTVHKSATIVGSSNCDSHRDHAATVFSAGSGSSFEIFSAATNTSTGQHAPRIASSVEEVLQFVNEDVLIASLPTITRHTTTPTLDRFEGCLVGVAVGDAVGLVRVQAFLLHRFTTCALLLPRLELCLVLWPLSQAA
jgi:hypothetical protein